MLRILRFVLSFQLFQTLSRREDFDDGEGDPKMDGISGDGGLRRSALTR